MDGFIGNMEIKRWVNPIPLHFVDLVRPGEAKDYILVVWGICIVKVVGGVVGLCDTKGIY